MTIPKELLDTLMKDYKNPEDLIGETGLLKQLTKQLLEPLFGLTSRRKVIERPIILHIV